MISKIFPYIRLLGGLLFVYAFAQLAPGIFSFFEKSADAELLTTFFIIGTLFALGFAVYYLSTGTTIPSFVIAIFFGMAAQKFLHPIERNHGALAILVSLSATLILFGGGLETPFRNFRKLFWKIILLSCVGLVLTAFLFSYGLQGIGNLFGMKIGTVVAVLLGAVLASTDPAAIIPVLKNLKFHNRSVKDIIISESAMTDVTGTLLTVIFLAVLGAGGVFLSIGGAYQTLFAPETVIVLLKQIIFGVMFGLLGYAALEILTRFKMTHEHESEVDAAFFVCIPIIISTMALSLGGSGYLAAFVAGLLFILTEHLTETERFFNHTIDGFLKPVIFLLLGGLVDVPSLLEYAAIGLLAALLFMFVIRPVAVLISLAPFSWFGKEKIHWREMFFISFVRETGAIPAVLLVTIVSLGIGGLESLVAIGMWVILGTLILEPPLTPLVAKWLKVAVPMNTGSFTMHETEPFIVLVSRGHSFKDRLHLVVEWANRHSVRRVILLHCLEDRHTKALEEQIGKDAAKEFQKFNTQRKKTGKLSLQFQYLPKQGYLQDNIKEIAAQQNIVAIFVGKKMLDYRLREIKKISAPFVFMN